MPQKDVRSRRADAGLGAPSTYDRKKSHARVGPIKGPKTEKAAGTLNMGFLNGLGGMIRNVEMITAAKLVNEGRIFRTGELKRLADEQLAMAHKTLNRTGKVPLLEKKHVKGIRGTLDLEEMAELVPSLKKHLDKEKADKERTDNHTRDLKHAAAVAAATAAERSAAGGAKKTRKVDGALMERAIRGAAAAANEDDDAEDGEGEAVEEAPAAPSRKRARLDGAAASSSSAAPSAADSAGAATAAGDAAAARAPAAGGSRAAKRRRSSAAAAAAAPSGARSDVRGGGGAGADLAPLFGAGNSEF